MNYRIFSLCVAIASCCACQRSPAEISAREIAQSIKFGEDASKVKPPYGLPLYPNAKVTMSMMGGTTIGVKVDARVEHLGQFYSAALKERGYRIDEDETKGGRRTIYATDPKKPADQYDNLDCTQGR